MEVETEQVQKKMATVALTAKQRAILDRDLETDPIPPEGHQIPGEMADRIEGRLQLAKMRMDSHALNIAYKEKDRIRTSQECLVFIRDTCHEDGYAVPEGLADAIAGLGGAYTDVEKLIADLEAELGYE